MICPQTKQECESVACERDGCVAQLAEMPRLPIAGRELLSIRKSSPLPPTLAEIEKLVDAYGEASDLCLDRCMFDEQKAVFDEQAKAKAALMAAIRAYGRE